MFVDQHDEWQATDRRYLSEGSMAQIDDPNPEVITSTTPNELTAAEHRGKHRGSRPHFHHCSDLLNALRRTPIVQP